MKRLGVVIVEGQGDADALANLLHRVGPSARLHVESWGVPIRHTCRSAEQVRVAAELARRRPGAGALLLTRDADDECPARMAPQIAGWLREERLPFPSAVVLFKPEYEVIFLPGSSPGGREWEAHRDVKGIISSRSPFGARRRYKPTVDQLRMTRELDLEVLRAAGVPCYGTFERALAFLAAHWGRKGTGRVYPEPAP